MTTPCVQLSDEWLEYYCWTDTITSHPYLARGRTAVMAQARLCRIQSLRNTAGTNDDGGTANLDLGAE